MKKLFSIFLIFCVCSASIFADTQGDEYDDGYVYETNGAGDRFLKIDLGGFFPLNFGKQLSPGFGASLGFYQFITNKFAWGIDGSIADNFTIGNKPLVSIPITLQVMFQPTISKFEFPLSAGIGISALNLTSLTYFPGFCAKATAGAFYRFSESWSFGIDNLFIWYPEIHKNKKYNDNLFMYSANLGVRFHF